AMKMQNFISSSDLLCWNIILKGNSAKSITTDKDDNLKIRPPVTVEEYQQVQREEKARTILRYALPDEHMGDFYHMIDVRDIWNAIKARFGENAESKKMQKSLLKQKFKEFKISKEEGLDKSYDKMQKIPSQMNTLKIKPEQEDVNIKFLRGLPPTWSSIALILKTKRGLEYNSFDDMYNKLKFLEIDTKGECPAQGGQNSNNYQKYKETGKDGTDLKAMVVVDGSEKQDLMTKLDNELANQAKWNNSGKNLYKLIDSSMSVRTKRGLGLDKYIRKGELGIDDSKFSIFHTNSDEFVGQPIYNRFTSVKHMKAVPPPLTGNYMPPSNIPDIDESQIVYGQKATDSSKIKTNDESISYSHDFVLFDFSDSESKDTVVIDCVRQEDFPSVCTSSIETNVKSSKTLCNKFGSSNKESHFRKHKSNASKSCYVCGSYLHLIKDCDFHEQRFAKRNAEGKGILKSRPTGKPVNQNRPKPVSAGRPKPVFAGRPNPISASRPIPISADQPNPVSVGQPNTVSSGDGILGSGPLNIQSKSTYFHSFTHNNQQIFFPITHNSLYSLYLTVGLNGKLLLNPQQVGLGQNMDNSLRSEKAKDKGIVDSGCSRSMSGNKDKLEDFEDFHGGEVTFGGSTRKITRKGTIKTKNLNFKNVLHVEELQHFNLISISQICDESHRVLFTENECLVLSKDFPLPDPSMVILSIPRKHNLYNFSLNELAPKGPLTCLTAKALRNESTLWHKRLGHVNFRNMNKLVKGNLVRGLLFK
nr:ribonuclease H-like domain-containing protein [Tanacetum cinerariifolium]